MTNLTMWVNLTSDIKSKVKSITNQKIYIPDPYRFNDIFDSQIHIKDSDLLKLISSKEDLQAIKFWIKAASWTVRIRCLSQCSPLSVKSNHMWGLYGGVGTGLAITYRSDDIKLWSEKNSIRHEEIKYDPEHCPLKLIKKYLVGGYFDDGDVNKNIVNVVNFFKEFIFTKTNIWQHENEFRILQIDENMLKHVADFTKRKKILHPSAGDSEALHAYMLQQKLDYSIEFIKPSSITLGWNTASLKPGARNEIKKIIDYAKKENVPINQLDRYINYTTNEFYTLENQ